MRLTTRAPVDADALALRLGLALGAVREMRTCEYAVDAEGTPERVVELACFLRDAGVELDELRSGRRSLEEVFLRLTSEGRVR
jgi:ABC-2 type transport system ATP-binding protein